MILITITRQCVNNSRLEEGIRKLVYLFTLSYHMQEGFMSQSHFSSQRESVRKVPGPEGESGSLCASVPHSGVSTHSQPMAVRDVLPGHIGAGIKAVLGSRAVLASGFQDRSA